jgi:hypothetical protein
VASAESSSTKITSQLSVSSAASGRSTSGPMLSHPLRAGTASVDCGPAATRPYCARVMIAKSSSRPIKAYSAPAGARRSNPGEGNSIQPIVRGSNLGGRDFTATSLTTRPYRPRYDPRRSQEMAWLAKYRRLERRPRRSQTIPGGCGRPGL